MDNQQPFFSIIIPTYNRADTIIKAVQSVIEQSFTDFELLIIDDGSTDNTEQKVNQIKDKRVRYFSKENEERSIARNFGINHSKGKYVSFLDSDDFYLNNHLKESYEHLKSLHNPSIMHTGYIIQNHCGKVKKIVDDLGAHTIDNLIFDNQLLCNSIFIKRKILQHHQFLNSKYATISEDWYLWLVLASRYEILFSKNATTVLVEHSKRSLNILNATKVKRSIDLIYKALSNDQKVLEKYRKRDLKNSFSRLYLFCAHLAKSQSDYLLLTTCLAKSSLLDPLHTMYRLFRKVLIR